MSGQITNSFGVLSSALPGKGLEVVVLLQMSPWTTESCVAGNMLPASYGLRTCCVCARACSRANTHTHTSTHTHTRICTHTNTHACAHTHTNTHACARTHTYAHKYTHAIYMCVYITIKYQYREQLL